MDLNDVELMETLPKGIIVDSNIKNLDKFGYSFALSGIDFETCVTYSCVKEVVRFSPIKLIISEIEFVGGNIADIVNLSRTSEKFFKVMIWTDKKVSITDEILEKTGIAGYIIKNQPFDEILQIVNELMSPKK